MGGATTGPSRGALTSPAFWPFATINDFQEKRHFYPLPCNLVLALTDFFLFLLLQYYTFFFFFKFFFFLIFFFILEQGYIFYHHIFFFSPTLIFSLPCFTVTARAVKEEMGSNPAVVLFFHTDLLVQFVNQIWNKYTSRFILGLYLYQAT